MQLLKKCIWWVLWCINSKENNKSLKFSPIFLLIDFKERKYVKLRGYKI